MKRRTFLLGTGGVAVGSSALIGSSAFTGVEATRTASVKVGNDNQGYLGLQPIEDGPNAGYVSYNDQGSLELQMNGDNPADGGGTGVNPDAYTYFDNLFRIVNQGNQRIVIVIVKYGDNASLAQFYDSDTLAPIDNPELDVGKSIPIGLETFTEDVESGTQLLEEIFITGIGVGSGTVQSVGAKSGGSLMDQTSAPEGGVPNTDYTGPSRTDN